MKKSKQMIYGPHAVDSAMRNDQANIQQIYCLREGADKRLATLLEKARKAGISVASRARKDLDKLAGGGNHQGIVAEYQGAEVASEADLYSIIEKQHERAPLILVLDGVQDPHSLGACLRTADAAGVDAVIAPKDKACGMTPVVRKVAAGAAESVPFVQVVNLGRTLRKLQELGVWVIGTAGEAQQSLYDVDLRAPIAILMGAEGKGMRRLTREICDELVNLPMAGEVSSLNVSVASGVCLFEAVRQRR